ncbi:unnamed protein product, partial [Rotaria sp. Silwood1]
VSGGGPNVQRIKSVILQSNPLLERMRYGIVKRGSALYHDAK